MDWKYEECDIKSLDLSEIIKTEKEITLIYQRRDDLAKWIMVEQAELQLNPSSK
jgi:hypothetical protein